MRALVFYDTLIVWRNLAHTCIAFLVLIWHASKRAGALVRGFICFTALCGLSCGWHLSCMTIRWEELMRCYMSLGVFSALLLLILRYT